MMTGSGGGGNNRWTDDQEWERKKAHQRAMMARGQGPDPKGLGNGALGVANVGAFAQQQASRGAAAKPSYPTPADLPKYNSLAERQQGQRDAFANIQKPGFGMGYSVKPNVPRKPIDDIAPNTNAATSSIDDIQPTYQESDNTGGILKGDGGGKRPGLSIDNNAAVAQPLAPAMGGGNGGFGFRVMPPPRKAYGEDSRRAALAMDIKPYKNGMGLTTGQVALKNSILNGDDEKYANEQYQGQLSAAQKMAQEGMQQAGENSRAQLTESGANSRANNQLGFDAEKFQQIAAIDKRKLDMQQSNDKIANYGVKKLNELRESWFNAETPEEKSAIAEQMAILNPKGSDDKGNYIAVSGGQEVDPETGATYDLPMKSFNKDTGVFTDQNEGEMSPKTKTSLTKIAASGKYSQQELTEIFAIAKSGGDISAYLN